MTEVAPESVSRALTIVLAGPRTSATQAAPLRARLCAYADGGGVLAGVGHGVYQLAAAGLLDGYQCVVPAELSERFAVEFPHVQVVSGHVTYIDRDRASSVAGTSVLNLMVPLIEARVGSALGGQVIAALAGNPGLSGYEPAALATEAQASGTCDRRLARALRLMQRNLAHPLHIGALSHAVGLSERELERLCRRTFGCTPSQLYLQLRLQAARRLIVESRDPVLAVALKCGFADTSHLDRYYRRIFLESPRRTRNESRTTQRASGPGTRSRLP
ncbi:MAG: GlxA family transcriptional regulator [Gammaproteobacteria bacterium]